MTSNSKLPLTLFIASIVVCVLSAFSRIFLTLNGLDSRYGVYQHGAILPHVYHISLAVALVLLIVFAIKASPKQESSYYIRKNDVTIFISCLCAFMLGANTLLSLFNVVSNGSAGVYDILDICFAIVAMLFFFGLIKKNDAPSTALAFVSLCPIAWCSVNLIRIYFDSTLLHTSSIKTFSLIALLGAMLYFLNEARMQLSIMSHRFFLSTALTAPILLITNAVPNLILGDKLTLSKSGAVLLSFIEIAFSIFIYCRLYAYIFKAEQSDIHSANE